MQALFPDRLYVEISRGGTIAVEEAAEAALIDLAYARDLPLVATNPAAYPDPSFPRRARCDAVHRQFGLCRKRRPRHARRPTPGSRTPTAMAELFADLPEALANTAVIAQRCAVAAPQRKPILPRLGDDEDEQLRARCAGRAC